MLYIPVLNDAGHYSHRLCTYLTHPGSWALFPTVLSGKPTSGQEAGQ